MTRDEAIHYAKCLKNNWTLNLNDLGEFYDMAIEALERKRGEWVTVKGSNGKDYRKCTNCLHTQEITGLLNYCPICGAEMRGGDHD